RSSSPGAYSLCSENSTLCPWWGLLWRPERTPSITARARTFTPASLASVAASSNSTGRLRLALHQLQQLGHDAGAGDALALGGEVGQHPVPEDGKGEGPHVLHRGRIAPLEHRPGLGRHHQVLAGPGTGAPVDVLADEVRGSGLLGPGVPHQLHRIA